MRVRVSSELWQLIWHHPYRPNATMHQRATIYKDDNYKFTQPTVGIPIDQSTGAGRPCRRTLLVPKTLQKLWALKKHFPPIFFVQTLPDRGESSGRVSLSRDHVGVVHVKLLIIMLSSNLSPKTLGSDRFPVTHSGKGDLLWASHHKHTQLQPRRSFRLMSRVTDFVWSSISFELDAEQRLSRFVQLIGAV